VPKLEISEEYVYHSTIT